MIVDRADDLILLSVRGGDLVEACAAQTEADLTDYETAEEAARALLMHNFQMPDEDNDEEDHKEARRLLDRMIPVSSD